MSRKKAPLFKRERLGLSMMAASLLAITVVCVLLYMHTLSEREQRTRAQGLSLLRALATLQPEQLTPQTNPTSILRTLPITDEGGDFAYATVTDVSGTPVAEVARPGILVPTWVPPAKPAAWLGERTLALSDGTPAIEFYAPILAGTEYAAHLRLGYVKPGLAQIAASMPFYASIALVVFLLMPLFYFLMRREVRPLKAAAAELTRALENGAPQSIQIDTNGEFGEFMGKFSQFVEFANERMVNLQHERERIVSSTKLLSYRKERALRVLESMPDAIVVMDESGAITVANARFATLLDVDVSAMIGATTLDWCGHETVHQFLTQCRGRETRRYLPEPVEFKVDEQREQTHSIKAFPLFSSDGAKSIGCLIVVQDVTLQALARVSRAEFVAHVAHELKTPLNVLSMYSEVLQNLDPEDHETRVEAANVIEDEVGRLGALINNMLSLTKIEMGSMDIDSRRTRVGDLLVDAFESAKHVRGADALTFDIDIPPQLGALSLDKDLLRIALNNLLSNAVKYNQPGGRITLSATETEETLRISVKDSGIGIAADDVPRVFEKFFRSDDNEVRDRTGHGLGLALAYDIIQLHNGTLSVESDLGEGTTFTIELFRDMHAMAEVG